MLPLISMYYIILLIDESRPCCINLSENTSGIPWIMYKATEKLQMKTEDLLCIPEWITAWFEHTTQFQCVLLLIVIQLTLSVTTCTCIVPVLQKRVLFDKKNKCTGDCPKTFIRCIVYCCVSVVINEEDRKFVRGCHCIFNLLALLLYKMSAALL